MTNPEIPAIISKLSINGGFYVPVAQLVEHLTFNQGVRGSSSRGRTKKIEWLFVKIAILSFLF